MATLIVMRGGALPVATTASAVETHRGEEYRLERREIELSTGTRKVWCWEVLSGPAEGHYGGKCATKTEARKWARNEIDAWAEEVARNA